MGSSWVGDVVSLVRQRGRSYYSPSRSKIMPNAIRATPQVNTHIERRKARRYFLSACAFYCWERTDGTLQEAQGITRDISDRGIFILAKELPPVGKYVELDVHLPEVTGKLHGEGIVVWTSGRDAEVTGFGASVLFRTESSDIATALGPERIQ